MTKFYVTMVFAGCALMCADGTVGAEPEEGQHYRIKNVHSELILAVSPEDKEEGAQIFQTPHAQNYFQQWKFVKVGDYYQIINRKTGLAMNVKSESKKEGAAVIQWDASGDHENQQWSLVKRGNFYKIKARHSEMFLDVAEKRKMFPSRPKD